MAGLPYVQAIRTISLFGLSDVKVQFTYDVTYEQASQMVINRLAQLAPCPTARSRCCRRPARSARSSATAWSARPATRVTDLKTIQDWVLQRRFKAIPGVIDVTGWGGKTKTYDITVDLDRLLAYGLTLKQVLRRAEQRQHQCRRQHGEHRLAVGDRALGRPDPLDGRHPQHHADGARRRAGAGVRRRHRDGRQPAAARHRRPERRRRHRPGHRADAPRRGDPADPRPACWPRSSKINSTGMLPPGVRIERIYDRSALVDITTHTVLHNMVMGVVADLPDPVAVPRRPAQRADRRRRRSPSRCCSPSSSWC